MKIGLVDALRGRSLAALLVVYALAADSPAQESLRFNLDLPFNAITVEQSDEDLPELIVFYSGVYEASSVVFCLDESLSMRKHGRWELQLREISRAISELSSEAEFGIVFYGAGAFPFRDRLVPADQGNKAAALAFLRGRQMSLGTCLGPGVVRSLQMLKSAKSKYRAVIVAGDGRPTRCPFVRGQGRMSDGEVQQLLAETMAANPGLSVRLHTILVGTDDGPRAEDFMRELSAFHRGTFRQVNR